MKSRLQSISCIVPCLNEEANLGVLLPGLLAVLKKLAPACEVIVVDDGSTDGTADLLSTWTRDYPELVHLQLSRNFGKEAALSAGLAAAKGQPKGR
jgi:glycosyltransferase involved in cell wall biosynthesis